MRLRSRLPLLRRITGGLFALWLVLLQLPVALPVTGSAGKDRSIPFPCMDRPCGCRSWAECWTSCCCTTKEERIAWAKTFNLPTPDGPAPTAVAARPKATAKHACCENAKSGGACETQAASRPARKSESNEIILSSVLRCRGLAMMLMQFAGAVATPVVELPRPPVVLTGRTPVIDDSSSSAELSPPSPPPRILATVVSL
jgi:hypothetical protein